MNDKDDGMWFAPKRFGIGSGLPIAWQGWLLLAAHIAVIAVGPLVLRHHPVAKFTWIALFVVLPWPIYAAKTRGGWKWRSGRD